MLGKWAIRITETEDDLLKMFSQFRNTTQKFNRNISNEIKKQLKYKGYIEMEFNMRNETTEKIKKGEINGRKTF